MRDQVDRTLFDWFTLAGREGRPWANRAIVNTKNESQAMLGEYVPSMHAALTDGFNWETAPEMAGYWTYHADKLIDDSVQEVFSTPLGELVETCREGRERLSSTFVSHLANKLGYCINLHEGNVLKPGEKYYTGYYNVVCAHVETPDVIETLLFKATFDVDENEDSDIYFYGASAEELALAIDSGEAFDAMFIKGFENAKR